MEIGTASEDSDFGKSYRRGIALQSSIVALFELELVSRAFGMTLLLQPKWTTLNCFFGEADYNEAMLLALTEKPLESIQD
jgi:hypothetical protein